MPFNEKKISVIIPVYNGAEFTAMCLDYLLRNSNLNLDIWVIDNASTDHTKKVLGDYSSYISVVRNESNLGFAKACNIGASEAKTDYLLFLNNDTVPHPNWDFPLYDELRNNIDVGIVGSRLIYPDNTIQHAGVAFFRTLNPYHIYENLPMNVPCVLKKRTMPALTGACFMLRKEDFIKVEGFNELFINGLEDIDLCLKVNTLGKSCMYVPESLLVHFGSRSAKRQLHMEANRSLFHNRWADKINLNDYPIFINDNMSLTINIENESFSFITKEEFDNLNNQYLKEAESIRKKGDNIGELIKLVECLNHLPYSLVALVKTKTLAEKLGDNNIVKQCSNRISMLKPYINKSTLTSP